MGALKKICVALMAAVMAFGAFACGKGSENGDGGNKGDGNNSAVYTDPYPDMNDYEFTVSQLAGTDSLGRVIMPTNKKSNDKYVGMFYNVNNSEADSTTPEIYDITKIMQGYDSIQEWLAKGKTLEEYFEYNPVFSRADDNEISPNGKTHWYAEPLFGYYANRDKWVIRKQMELLGLMGVDFIMIDLTNYPYYFQESVTAVLDVLVEMLDEGVTVPQAMLVLPTFPQYAKTMLNGCYTRYYGERKYRKVWFVGDESVNPSGKAWVVGNFKEVDRAEWSDKLFLKQMQWPTDEPEPDAMPWIDWNEYQHNHNGIMNVSPSQHLDACWSSRAYLEYNSSVYRARGWTYGDTTTGYEPEKVAAGANYAQQWNYAISGKGGEVKIATVTGWNEWAMRKIDKIEEPNSLYAPFVDEFDLTYSRELEPVAGAYGDNYAFQTAMNIRAFKGLTESEAVGFRASPNISDGAAWDSFSRKYLDAVGEIGERNMRTYASGCDLTYTDTTARNDISYLKIVNDGENLYVQVVCKEKISEYKSGDKSWMNLYISTGDENGWENYNYVINGAPNADGTTSVEKLSADKSGKPVRDASATARYCVFGNAIAFEIPLSAIGQAEGKQIQIKATDNVGGSLAGGSGTPFRSELYGNAWDFYLYGDVAPAGRLNYAYKLA